MKDSINKNARGHRSRVMTAEKFWGRIQKPVGCWLFDGARETNGYGYLANPFGGEPKYMTAHRVAWIFANGPIPAGLLVLHKCDVRSCVNPDHLFLGTDADNTADKIAKDRHRGSLKADQVREIRRLLGTMYQKDIAAKFGVDGGAISHIKKGHTYTWVK